MRWEGQPSRRGSTSCYTAGAAGWSAQGVSTKNAMTTQKERAESFKALHERPGAFVIPNPWDIGAARLLAGLGFEALATTSAGFANSLGRLDGQVTRHEAIEHCRTLCAAVDLPVSADLENCFAHEPAQAAATLLAGAEAGLVGCS